MIKEKSVQLVMETARIEDVVGEFVNLKKRGVNLIGLCPFHNEKTPSFTVSPAKNICKCFGCGKGGSPVHFLMEQEQLSFPEAIKYLANKYGLEIEETVNTDEQVQERQLKDSLFILNQFANDYYKDQLFNTDIGKSVGLNYFKQRGFQEATIEKFGLGYAPEAGSKFTQKAIKEGYDKELLQKLGLTSDYGKDFFRSRVMFSIRNQAGKIIGFGGRIMVNNVKAPKYVNSPQTEIYNKSKVLYGSYFAKKAIRKQDECILVEGYTDVISLHQSGIENVVASSGTSLTVDQIRLIKRNTENIKILYDGDPAGVKAALRGLDLVLEEDMNVKVVLLPEGEDPDSYLKSVGTTAFQEYIDQEAKDFILFKMNLLMEEAANDPVKKTALIRDIISSIAKIPDPLKRNMYIKECAVAMQFEEKFLVMEANKHISENFRKKSQREQRGQREQAPFPGVEPPTQNQSQSHFEQSEPKAPERQKTQGDEFFEKDIAKVLISYGDQYFEKEQEITVAQYVLKNIADVIDQFDHPMYEKIVRMSMELVADRKPVNSNFFINHQDEKVRKEAINLIHSPFDYSPNWHERWGIELTTQPMPDENYKNHSIGAVRMLKFRKVIRLYNENNLLLRAASETGDHDQMMVYLKMQQKLMALRNELAKQLNIVVLK